MYRYLHKKLLSNIPNYIINEIKLLKTLYLLALILGA